MLAKRLATERGVGFDAPMSMAVHLSPPPALSALLPFSDDIPDSRWGKGNALQFAQLLREFYRDADFHKFFAAHQPMYHLAEERFGAIMADFDLNWYKEFYGEVPRGRFNLILGMNNGGGNYGPKVVFPDRQEELYAIIGSWSEDDSGDPTYDKGYLGMIIHEFNHSFINPLVDERKDKFASAEEVYKDVADKMQANAYGSSEVMIQESLVRAAVILYFESHGHDSRETGGRIYAEQANGFLWMDDLCGLLRQYAAQRSKYPTFSSFMPAVVQFYRELSPRIAEMKAGFEKSCVRVTGLQSFPNHSQDVDPTIRELIVTFDKPLDPGHYTIKPGLDGQQHFPITGKPEYLPGNLSIKLPITLKPEWSYSFVLTCPAFVPPGGSPFENYTVDFKTRR
ncbi:MAG: DUF4932 domain-containing protein [Terriglobales bacterium]|jgi:hypothetical protein